MAGWLPVMLAVEDRFKAAVVAVAGLRHQKTQPEADPFNYLPQVTLPVLMLNGRYDFYFRSTVTWARFADFRAEIFIPMERPIRAAMNI